ncbi:MAG TPA: NHL repeat-containing protein [Stenomitos sp.]
MLLAAGCATMQTTAPTLTPRGVQGIDLYASAVRVAVEAPRRVQSLPDFWDQAEVTFDGPKLRAPMIQTVATHASAFQVEFRVPPGPATVSVQLKTRGMLVASGQATASVQPGPNAIDITLATLDNLVMTLAGDTNFGFVDGQGQAARFYQPMGMTADDSGNLYVADYQNHSIRKVTPDGVVTTVAGNGTPGWADGIGSAARLCYPTDVAYYAPSNCVYVADSSNHVIRRLDLATNTLSTSAGSPSVSGFADGVGSAALFNTPQGLAVDASGDVYVADFWNQCIRKMTPAGSVTLIAGTRSAGSQDGAALSATFNGPRFLTFDPSGDLLIAELYSNLIRKLGPSTVYTVAGSPSVAGFANGVGSAAMFNQIGPMTRDAFGTVYVCDENNHTVRSLDPANLLVDSVFGTSAGYLDGAPTTAQFQAPCGIVARGDRLYVSDRTNHCIRVYRQPPSL